MSSELNKDWSLEKILINLACHAQDNTYYQFHLSNGDVIECRIHEIENLEESDRFLLIQFTHGSPYLINKDEIAYISIVTKNEKINNHKYQEKEVPPPPSQLPSPPSAPARTGPGPVDPEIHERIRKLKISTKSNPMLLEEW